MMLKAMLKLGKLAYSASKKVAKCGARYTCDICTVHGVTTPSTVTLVVAGLTLGASTFTCYHDSSGAFGSDFEYGILPPASNFNGTYDLTYVGAACGVEYFYTSDVWAIVYSSTNGTCFGSPGTVPCNEKLSFGFSDDGSGHIRAVAQIRSNNLGGPSPPAPIFLRIKTGLTSCTLTNEVFTNSYSTNVPDQHPYYGGTITVTTHA